MSLTLSQRKRIAIIDAAIFEFRDKGYQASSMDAVAARANVSKRTVYNHFESKDVLLAELMRQMVEMGRQATRCVFDEMEPIEAQLERIARQELALLSHNRYLDLSRILMAEAMHRPDYAKDVLAEVSDQPSYFEQWIAEGKSAGKLNDVDAVYVTRQFLGLIKAHALWPQLLTNQPAPAGDVEDLIVESAVRSVMSLLVK